MSYEENARQGTDGKYALRGKIKDLYDLFMIEDANGNVDMETSCKALHETLKIAEDGLREIRVPSQEELAEEDSQDALLRALDFNENDETKRPFKQRWAQSERKLRFNEKKKRLEIVKADRSSQSMPHLLLIKELAESGFGGLDIVFEYMIPGTARRADAVIIGETEPLNSKSVGKRDYVLIIECKSWDSSNWGKGGFNAIYHPWTLCSDGDVRASKKKDAPNRGFSETLHHPLFQALAYRNFLNNFHSEALNSNWWIESACFLPDVDATSFLHCSEPNFSQAECKAINDSVDSYAFNAANQIAHFLSGTEKRTEVAPSERTEAFLSDSFVISAERKAGRVISNICKAVAACKMGAKGDGDTRFTDKQVEYLSSMIMDDSKRIVVLPVPCDEEFNKFVSSADLAMSLQNALLHTQDATESISLQTNDRALTEIREALDTSNAYKKKAKIRYALNRLFIEKSMAFNVFNAYKWESAVYTSVGIVDLCSWRNDKREKERRPEAKELKRLDAFLEKSTTAGTIFLLVDDEGHGKEDDAKDNEKKRDDEDEITLSKLFDHLVAKYPKESVARFDIYNM